MEQVLAVNAQLLNLPGVNYIHRPDELKRILDICSENYLFISRPLAEQDLAHKQLIPYVTILCQGHYLCLERTAAQGEARLHGKLSLGVGGHVNPVDNNGSFDQIISQAMNRELKEELWLDTNSSPLLYGLINDDSNSVGKVHLAMHFLLQLDVRPLVRETEKMTASWYSLDQLTSLRQRMETWSQILLPALINRGDL